MKISCTKPLSQIYYATGLTPCTLRLESYGYSEENMVLTIKEGNLQSFQTETYQDNASRFQKDIKIMEVVGDRHTTKSPIKTHSSIDVTLMLGKLLEL